MKDESRVGKLPVLRPGRCGHLGSPKSLLSRASQLSGANAAPLFTFRNDRCLIPRPPGGHHHRKRGMKASGARLHHRSPELAAGRDVSCLLRWQEVFSFCYLCNRRPWGSPKTRGFPDLPENNTSAHSGQAILLVCVCVLRGGGWRGAAPCSKVPQVCPL